MPDTRKAELSQVPLIAQLHDKLNTMWNIAFYAKNVVRIIVQRAS